MAGPPQALSPSELVRSIAERLRSAADAARAADACVEAGNTDRALAMLSDIEPPLYEVMTLLNAASIWRGDHAG